MKLLGVGKEDAEDGARTEADDWLWLNPRGERPKREEKEEDFLVHCTGIHVKRQIIPAGNAFCRCQLVFWWMTAIVRGPLLNRCHFSSLSLGHGHGGKDEWVCELVCVYVCVCVNIHSR